MVTGGGSGVPIGVAASSADVTVIGNSSEAKITVPGTLVVIIVTLPVAVVAKVDITAMFRFFAVILAIVRFDPIATMACRSS